MRVSQKLRPRQKEAIYLSSPVYCCRVDQNSEKLPRFKVAADTLMTFAGDIFLPKK